MRIASAAVVLIDGVGLSESRRHIRIMRLSTLGLLSLWPSPPRQLVSEPSKHVLHLRLRLGVLRRKSCGTSSGTSKVSTNSY